MREVSGPDDFAEVFKVPRETIHRLKRYAELLGRWQKTTNLVAASTLDHLWGRHFADSAQLVTLAPDARLWLDLGSGAGFPGLVVSLLRAQQPAFRVHLVEKSPKKSAFLAEVVRSTGAPAEIHTMRIEDLAAMGIGSPDAVSARALAPLPELLALAEPFVADKTKGLFLKGRQADFEIAAARNAWNFDLKMHPSLTAPDARILEISALRRHRAVGGKT